LRKKEETRLVKIAPAISSIDVDESKVDTGKVKQLLSEMLRVYQEVEKAKKTSKRD
jgi:hypothetical protein